MSVSRTLYLSIGYLLLGLGISPIISTFFSGLGNIIEPFIFLGVCIISKKEAFRIPFFKVFRSQRSVVALGLLLIFGLIGLVTPT